MKCYSTLDSPLYKENPVYPGIWGGRVGGGSPITVSDYELYMSCSFNTVYSLPALSLLNIHTNIFVGYC